MPSPALIFAADVGGTNCRLALVQGDRFQTITAVHPGRQAFGEVARIFLGTKQPAAACVAVAGPVVDGRATLTNRNWTLDAAEISAALGCPTLIVNDFQAATRGIAALGPSDSRPLAGPIPDPKGAVVALGPGTGLGLGWMVLSEQGWQVTATEGGHQDLAPHDVWEADLWHWLHERHGHVSWERVLSGPGLVTLHDFAVRRGLAGLPDPSPALVGTDDAPACAEARRRFAALLGHFAGNCALAHLPRGGVWICGGVAPRLSSPAFDAQVVGAYRDKGRFAGLLDGISLALVTTPDLGLRGAAAFARGLRPAQ